MRPAQLEQLPLVRGAPALAQQQREQALGMPLHGPRQQRFAAAGYRRRIGLDRRDFCRTWKLAAPSLWGSFLHGDLILKVNLKLLKFCYESVAGATPGLWNL